MRIQPAQTANMKLAILLVCLFAVAAVSLGGALDSTAYDKVNVFIASGGLAYGYGSINPGAQMPFGAMRLGPDTTIKAVDVGYRHFSGYNSQDNVVRAFSHTHLFGAGVNDLGNFGIMPFNLRNTDDLLSNTANFWWSKFSKDTEKGAPGYYAVTLQEPNVDVQLLAVNNLVGVHKYTWKDLKSSKLQLPGLVLDICHAAKLKTGDDNPCVDATLNIDPMDNTKFTGAVSFDGAFTSGMWIYVAGEISTDSPAIKPSAWRVCSGQNIRGTECGENTGRVNSTSGNLFGIQTFTPTSKTFLSDSFSVTVKVAISFISEEQALLNLNSSPAHGKSSFDTLRSSTQTEWSNMLNTLSVSTLENEDLDVLMHSAHYRTLCAVADYTEVGGIYKGADKQLHNVVTERSGFAANSAPASMRFYSDLSLWDTFRTLHPFLLLTQEPLSVGIARSMGEITAQQNAFPRWMLGWREGSCMLGLHGSAFILEAAKAGLSTEFDIAGMQKALLTQSTTNVPLNGRADVDNYMTQGFVSQEGAGDGASHTLSYAYDDFLLGGLSELVGDATAASDAFKRAKNYRNIWSNESRIFCGKHMDGQLECPKDPASLQAFDLYREGDALHWAFFVPHDVPGLIDLHASPENFQAALSDFMSQHVPFSEKFGKYGVPNLYYWAGNEHNHLSPYLFSYVPKGCVQTQYWSRQLTYLHYSNTPQGVPGNEDYGAMGSWLLFTSLGLFPLAGTSTFFLTSPRVTQASLAMARWGEGGAAATSTLKVITHDNSKENIYVQKVLLNGVEYTSPFIDRSVLVGALGGEVTLEFFMHDQPTSGMCL